jgi:hypothetical protein
MPSCHGVRRIPNELPNASFSGLCQHFKPAHRCDDGDSRNAGLFQMVSPNLIPAYRAVGCLKLSYARRAHSEWMTIDGGPAFEPAGVLANDGSQKFRHQEI